LEEQQDLQAISAKIGMTNNLLISSVGSLRKRKGAMQTFFKSKLEPGVFLIPLFFLEENLIPL